MEKSKVYFTSVITSESLIKIYEALKVELKGKVGVKISTGEPGGHNFLNPKLIEPLVTKLNGTIVECCTAYGGKRQDPKDHWKAIEDHGFKAIAPCDIMDETGEFSIPVTGGFHLSEDIVGEHLKNYDSILMLSHFKGHAMGGFGGALKNMSIGVASSNGKANIHTAGKVKSPSDLWGNLPKQDEFLESMADACKGVMDYIGRENIVYINVAEKQKMADIVIFASVDPVAIDQACYDAVKNSNDEGKSDLIERMDSRHGIHTVEAASELGLGNREYEIVNLD